MIVRWLTAAAIVVTATVIGVATWVAGIKGFANRAESICLADTDNRVGYGAYEISRKLWWPSFECRLLGNAVDPVDVQHPLEAIVAFGWVVMVPVLYAIATLALTLRWARQTHSEHDM